MSPGDGASSSPASFPWEFGGVFLSFFSYKKEFPNSSGMVASLLHLEIPVAAVCSETAEPQGPFGVQNPPGHAFTAAFLPKPDPCEWICVD